MDTTNHTLIGKRIEHANGIGGIVTHIGTDADGDFTALLITDAGDLHPTGIHRGWRIVTPEPTATAAPEPDADGWIPLDGTRFPDVEPDAKIVVKFREGTENEYRANTVGYFHSGGRYDVLAWRRA
jgi:hypothetical protein